MRDFKFMLNEQKSIEGFYTQLFHLYDVKIQNDAYIHPFHPIKIHVLKSELVERDKKANIVCFNLVYQKIIIYKNLSNWS